MRRSHTTDRSGRNATHDPTDGVVVVTRRGALTGGVTLAVGLAGCLGLGDDPSETGDTETPDPVTLTQEDRCDQCGMVIPNHPGPNAEIFYADRQPSGHENPARFCSTWEAFAYDFEPPDWDREVFYATDYSTVDYEIRTDAGETHISSHVRAGDFVDATGVTFVAGSEVRGAMGEDLIGFSDREDASQFQSEYGGQLVAFEDVSETTIQQLGSQ